MNKNFKVFQIHGLTGLLFVCIIMACLICGFVLFPIWLIMTGWNGLVQEMQSGPIINYYQASLLWASIALCTYLFLKNSIKIKIYKSDEFDEDLNEEHIAKIIEEEEKES